MVTSLKNWLTAASYSETSVSTWLAGLVIILMLSFLWSTVVRKIAGGAVATIDTVAS